MGKGRVRCGAGIRSLQQSQPTRLGCLWEVLPCDCVKDHMQRPRLRGLQAVIQPVDSIASCHVRAQDRRKIKGLGIGGGGPVQSGVRVSVASLGPKDLLSTDKA